MDHMRLSRVHWWGVVGSLLGWTQKAKRRQRGEEGLVLQVCTKVFKL